MPPSPRRIRPAAGPVARRRPWRRRPAAREPAEADRPAPAATWRQALRRTGPLRSIPRFIFVTVLGVVASAAGVYTFVEDSFKPAVGTAPMGGDVNIVLAGFGIDSDDLRPSAAGLAKSIVDELDARLDPLRGAGFAVEVRGPEGSGTSGAERDTQLTRLAQATNADVVVSARLGRSTGTTSLTPELFLADRKLAGAAELAGYHALTPIPLDGGLDSNPVVRRAARERVLDLTRGVARLIVGLGYYGDLRSGGSDRYAQAAAEFEAARRDWRGDARGHALLALLSGNTAGKRGRLAEARSYYLEAVSLAPESSRARLGLAELAFHEAKGRCEQGAVDAAAMWRVADEYQVILSGPQVPGADPHPKAAYGLGRSYLCLSQALVADLWSAARQHFQRVVDEFHAGNARIQQLAAESYAGLAVTRLPFDGAANPTAAYQAAAEAYEQAIRYTADPGRRAVLDGDLAFVQLRLGQTAAACQLYREGISLDPGNAGLARAAAEAGCH